MKEWYIVYGACREQNHARVLHFHGNTYELRKLWVWPHCRGRGFGGELLREVCADADHEGVTLRLTVSAFGYNAPSDRTLLKWYARHGFVRRQGFDMERSPKPWSSASPRREAPPPQK